MHQLRFKYSKLLDLNNHRRSSYKITRATRKFMVRDIANDSIGWRSTPGKNRIRLHFNGVNLINWKEEEMKERLRKEREKVRQEQIRAIEERKRRERRNRHRPGVNVQVDHNYPRNWKRRNPRKRLRPHFRSHRPPYNNNNGGWEKYDPKDYEPVSLPKYPGAGSGSDSGDTLGSSDSDQGFGFTNSGFRIPTPKPAPAPPTLGSFFPPSVEEQKSESKDKNGTEFSDRDLEQAIKNSLDEMIKKGVKLDLGNDGETDMELELELDPSLLEQEVKFNLPSSDTNGTDAEAGTGSDSAVNSPVHVPVPPHPPTPSITHNPTLVPNPTKLTIEEQMIQKAVQESLAKTGVGTGSKREEPDEPVSPTPSTNIKKNQDDVGGTELVTNLDSDGDDYYYPSDEEQMIQRAVQESLGIDASSEIKPADDTRDEIRIKEDMDIDVWLGFDLAYLHNALDEPIIFNQYKFYLTPDQQARVLREWNKVNPESVKGTHFVQNIAYMKAEMTDREKWGDFAEWNG